MRFRSFLAACVLPLVAIGAVYGCSNAPAPEDLCGWLQNPDSVNCVSHFHADLKDQCGAADSATVSGTFPTRNMLGMCVLNGKGGSVTFDPPIEIGAPPTGMPMTMKFTNADGTDCGEVAYTSAYSWSIKLVAPVIEGAGGSSSATTGTSGGGQSSGPSYSQGMISVTRVGGDSVDVACPAPDIHSATDPAVPELHHFNLNQVLSSTVENGCPQYAEIIPQAILELDPGGINRDGSLRLKIQYPPQAAKITSGAGGAGGATATTGTSSTPATIVPDTTYYFDCLIPGAPQLCTNGMKDASEVDVDCGGPESTPGCPARCSVGQLCVDTANSCDCDANTVCEVAKDGTKRCTVDAMLPTPPLKGVCSQIICANQVKDGSESDVDCGGLCPSKCIDGKKCVKNDDCVGTSCTLGICGPPTCMDKAANGMESDVDCGGITCPKCIDGMKCKSAEDCTSKGCLKKAGDLVGVCSQCADEVKNGSESDKDCGGKCAPCGEGKTCTQNSDCATNICNKGVCNSCSDGMKDGKETDTDCGGPVCGKCPEGKACTVAADCQFNGCLNGVCSRCGDNKQNDAETDVDCGGGMCAKCPNGKVCAQTSDCADGTCDNNRCGSCSDGLKGASESDVDCGGACNGCVEGKICLSDADCALKYCDFPPIPDGGVQGPGMCNTCNNKIKDGTETGPNCGGATCPKCLKGIACKINLDCMSGICIGQVCK